MSTIKDLLSGFNTDLQNGLKYNLNKGKKLVGCVYPVYCPEELVTAAGMVPIGLMGSETRLSEAGNYFPPFMCSIVQSICEDGIQGRLKDLSMLMTPTVCDHLRALHQNFIAAVPGIPVEAIALPLNREVGGAVTFLEKRHKKLAAKLGEIAGITITDDMVREAIEVHNEHRAAMRDFVAVAKAYPHLISATDRNRVIVSQNYYDKAEHAAMVRELVAACWKEDKSSWTGKKIILSGVTGSLNRFVEILDENNVAVVWDDMLEGSHQFLRDVSLATGDPYRALANHFIGSEPSCLLYNPKKERGIILGGIAKDHAADGVIDIQITFCEPEDFDWPTMLKDLKLAQVPAIKLEMDLQGANYGKIETALQTFLDTLSESSVTA